MKSLYLLLILILTNSVFAQLDRSQRPAAAAAQKINIPASQVFTTANGITVILSENHKIPKVSIEMSLGSTPRLEGEKAGLADFAGSLLMSGTATRSKDQLDREIDFIGANLSAGSSSMYLSCLTKHLDKGLDLMTEVL